MAINHVMSEEEQRRRLAAPMSASSEEASGPLWVPEHDYLPRQDRTVIRSLRAAPGIVSGWDFWVQPTQPASWDILIGPGRAIIDGGVNPLTQGSYICYAEDTARVAVEPAHPTLKRIDRVCIHVHDQENSIEEGFSWSREVITGDPGVNAMPPEPPNALTVSSIIVQPGAPNVDATFQARPYDRPGTATINWWNIRRSGATSMLWHYSDPDFRMQSDGWNAQWIRALEIDGGWGGDGVLANLTVVGTVWSTSPDWLHELRCHWYPGTQHLQVLRNVNNGAQGNQTIALETSCMFGPGQDIYADLSYFKFGGGILDGNYRCELWPMPPGSWLNAHQNPDGGWWD